jgi:hypothetical protein
MTIIHQDIVSQTPRIPFVTLKVISHYQRKVQNKNNYSETKETLLLASTRNGHLPRGCPVGTAHTQCIFHLVSEEGVTTGDYLKI